MTISPVITSITPVSGSTQGNTYVEIAGNYFPNDGDLSQFKLYFGDAIANDFVLVNNTLIRLYTPWMATGGVDGNNFDVKIIYNGATSNSIDY